MSAKGVTGNQLPNNNEVGGRSGEGREGKSNGQMVGDTAEGKEGRTTPTRLSPSPFESGSVDDKSKNSKGGATGGGKLSGTGEEGLRGPMPPPSLQKLKRLAEQQVKLRQEAESLVVELRKQRKPTGDLESAVTANWRSNLRRRPRRKMELPFFKDITKPWTRLLRPAVPIAGHRSAGWRSTL